MSYSLSILVNNKSLFKVKKKKKRMKIIYSIIFFVSRTDVEIMNLKLKKQTSIPASEIGMFKIQWTTLISLETRRT